MFSKHKTIHYSADETWTRWMMDDRDLLGPFPCVYVVKHFILVCSVAEQSRRSPERAKDYSPTLPFHISAFTPHLVTCRRACEFANSVRSWLFSGHAAACRALLSLVICIPVPSFRTVQRNAFSRVMCARLTLVRYYPGA